MKKRHLIILIVAILLLILIAVIIILAMLKKPDDGALDEWQVWQQSYEEVAKSREIKQTITVKKGNIEQFVSDKLFTATNNGYTVTGSEKCLNEVTLDTEEAYTTTPIDYKLDKNAQFVPTLTLKEEYFSAGYKLTTTVLEGQINAGKESAVLGLTEQLPAPTANMTLKLTASVDGVTRIEIAYVSNGSTVNIILTFAY